MKIKQKNIDGGLEKTVRKAQDFETTLVDIRKRNERRAWLVAGVSVFVSLCLIFGLFYMMPLKREVPYIVMADAYSGTASVAKFSGDWQNSKATASDVIARSNLAHYVVSRESFDRKMTYLRDWKVVYAMSDADISSGYKASIAKSNPDSPLVVYGDKGKSIRVKVFDIRVLKNRAMRPVGGVVRFQRFIYDNNTNLTTLLDNKIATIEFTYRANLSMPESYRIENPLGFQVVAYRVESDYVGGAAQPNFSGATPANVVNRANATVAPTPVNSAAGVASSNQGGK